MKMRRSMAKARKGSTPPSTVSRPALLVGGSDGEFRKLIHDLIAYGHRLDACRDAFAAIVGIAGQQHRSGAFITIEANKLVELGILQKASEPEHDRRVLLKNTSKSLHLLE